MIRFCQTNINNTEQKLPLKIKATTTLSGEKHYNAPEGLFAHLRKLKMKKTRYTKAETVTQFFFQNKINSANFILVVKESCLNEQTFNWEERGNAA